MTRTFAAALLAATALVSTAQAQGYRSTIRPIDPQAMDDAFQREEQRKDDQRRRGNELEERRQRMFEGQKARQDEAERRTRETIERRQRKRDEKKAAIIEEQRRLEEERARKAREAQLAKEEEDKAFLQRCPIGSPCWMQSGNRPQAEIDEWNRQTMDRINAEQAEAERAAKMPVNRVVDAYAVYIIVRICHESRDGYLVQYISEPEMKRAEEAVKATVDKAMAEDPSIDKARAWDDARAHARKTTAAASIEFCQHMLNRLYAMSPVGQYKFGRPE